MLQVELIPAFEDNYIWLLTEPGNSHCAVVDPGDDEPVMEALGKRGLELSAILVTHKHYDHVGGVEDLKNSFPDAVVFGPANEGIRQVEQMLSGGENIELPGMSLSFEVIDVPGHTEGHIAYLGNSALFCGDTLFAGGCGRVFTGTFEQLADSLRKIRQLPPETQIYCAHEYTEANLGFAQWVEPENQVLKHRVGQVQQMRENGHSTVPSTLEIEIETNPFLRVACEQVIRAAEKWAGKPLSGEAAVFTALRQWKDKDYD